MDKIFADQISKSNISNVVFVSQAGHDTFGTGDLVNPYKTIQRAINMSSVNGTVVIDSGTYTENLTIIDGISLKSMSKRTVVVIGKLTVNVATNNHVICDGIDFRNSIDHTVNLISPNSHNISFYECGISQTGTGAFNALNAVTIAGGDSQWKNCQISTSITTGGSKAIQIGVNTFGMTMFDCLIGVEDDADAVAIEHNGTAGFIFVGKNIDGQVVAQGDALVLLAYGGITTNTVPVLITTMATQPAIILNANIITNANPCVTGTGLFLFGNVMFFNGSYLDFASTLTGGAGAQAFPMDSAMGMRYRNAVSGLTATNIQAAIDELKTLISAPVSTSVPIGTEIFFENSNPDTPAPSTEFVQANGQVISDALSPYNGKRIRNLNGATAVGIAITALDDTLKTFTVALSDVYALMVGDSLTPDVSVPNAVVKSVDYTTGVIEVGDVSLWSSGSFGLTTSTLTGATTFDVVGLKRFTRGNSSNSGGGGVNAFQGHNIYNSPSLITPSTGIDFGLTSAYGVGGGEGVIITDGVNGTPRTSSDTTPNYADGVWLKKIK